MPQLDTPQIAPLDTRDRPLDLAGRRVHFVGIGGCGMSGLARIVRSMGACVGGTDMAAGPYTDALLADDVPVALRQSADTVPADCDLLVISAAVKPDHPEVAEARRRGVRVMKYAQLLGRLMVGRTGVAVAGTHGKSTTTAMLAHVLIRCGVDPSFIVGATCEQIGGGCRVGRPDLLLGEACEYDRSFHNFHPTHSVILNVEADHLDVYGSLGAVVEAFHGFAAQTAPHGSLLIDHDGPHREAVAAGLGCAVESIGFSREADWRITIQRGSDPHGSRTRHGACTPGNQNSKIQDQKTAAQRITLSHHGDPVCAFACQLPGTHMAYNAAVAAVTARRLGAKWQDIGEAMTDFRGLDRRMQALGAVGGVTVVDDYGHHPTEIRTTLRALREHHRPHERGGRLICVFQPHQHSRTRFLLDDFAASFSQADAVIVPHIYFVRDSEADREAVTAGHLVERLRERGVAAEHIDSFDGIIAHLQRETRPGDLLVVMGAGPVWKVAHGFMGGG